MALITLPDVPDTAAPLTEIVSFRETNGTEVRELPGMAHPPRHTIAVGAKLLLQRVAPDRAHLLAWYVPPGKPRVTVLVPRSFFRLAICMAA